MLDDKICKKREELNKSIEMKQDYSITYKLSVELDELIAEYYKEIKCSKKKKCTKEKKRKACNYIKKQGRYLLFALLFYIIGEKC